MRFLGTAMTVSWSGMSNCAKVAGSVILHPLNYVDFLAVHGLARVEQSR